MSEIIANLIARNRALEKRLNYLETQEADSSGDTASNILTKLLTVDGSGSGLDADLLDGYHASSFGLLAGTNTWTQPNVFTVAGANFRLSSSYYGPDLYVNTSGGWARQYTLRNDNAGATMRFGVGAYGDGTGPLRGYMVFKDGDDSLYTSTLGIQITSGGNVGIGTTSPAYPLHVSGNAAIDNGLLYMRKPTTGTLAYVLAVSAVLPDATIVQSAGGGVTLRTSAGASVLTATEGGNVGIGTTTPDVHLVVYSNSTNPAIKVEAGASGSFPLYQMVDGRASGVNWNIENGRVTGALGFYQSGGGTRLLIDSDGNIGINTTSPLYGVNIFQKSFALSGTLGTMYMEDNGATINFSRGGANYIRANHASGSLIFTTGGTGHRLTINANGSFNFATPSTATPTVYLDRYSGQPTVKSVNAWLIMDSNGSGAALNYWSTDPVILAYGNGSGGGVAIGQTTVTSGYKLDVAGAIRQTSFTYQATSDARYYINAGGTLRFLDSSGSTNLKVGIGITPAGQFHNYDGTGGTLHITKSNFTSELLVANGVGDIAYGATVNYVVRPSTGSIQAGNISIITPSSGYTDWTIFTTGSNTLMLRIYADGSLYAIRTAGSYTYYISLHITYL